MKIRSCELQSGDVMLSGEIVENVFFVDSKKMEVSLINPKNRKKRKALWSKNGTLYIEKRNIPNFKMIQEISYKGEKFYIQCDNEWDENVVIHLCEKYQNGNDVFRCIWDNHCDPYDFLNNSGDVGMVECALDNPAEFREFSALAESFVDQENGRMKKDEMDYAHQKEWYKR